MALPVQPNVAEVEPQPRPDDAPATRQARRVARRRVPQASQSQRPAILDYWELTKPEISFLVALSALAGYLLGAPEAVQGWTLLATVVGTALSAGGSGVLNHYLERDLDRTMRRTANRPLPAGRVSPMAALAFGAGLALVGIGILCAFVNVLTSTLASLTVALYLFVYTPLKRLTTYNTLVGTVPGALPALGGYAAATGTVGLPGWSLFAVLALWQMPHFLSLAWMYRKDYARAGYAMLPVVEPDGASTARQTLLFTVLLAAVSLALTLIGAMGWVYLVGAAGLGGWFLMPAYAFYRSRTTPDARRVLIASILYIPLLVMLIVLDRLIHIPVVG